MSIDPAVLSDLIKARDAEDWKKVAGIIDWLREGLGASASQPKPGR